MIYTLIGYKPESADTCRGCLMQSYSSDFHLAICETEEELIKEWVGLLWRNLQLENSEAGFEITLLQNGKEVSNFDDDYIRLLAVAMKEANGKLVLAKAQEHLKQIQHENAVREAEITHERAQYERLKSKFGL